MDLLPLSLDHLADIVAETDGLCHNVDQQLNSFEECRNGASGSLSELTDQLEEIKFCIERRVEDLTVFILENSFDERSTVLEKQRFKLRRLLRFIHTTLMSPVTSPPRRRPPSEPFVPSTVHSTVHESQDHVTEDHVTQEYDVLSSQRSLSSQPSPIALSPSSHHSSPEHHSPSPSASPPFNPTPSLPQQSSNVEPLEAEKHLNYTKSPVLSSPGLNQSLKFTEDSPKVDETVTFRIKLTPSDYELLMKRRHEFQKMY
ncbi:hypothetical protein GEMRC1_011661 [Eukaryota sp. GEM-RC1]